MPNDPIQEYLPPIKGRGAASNPNNRFDEIHLTKDSEYDPPQDPAPKTQFFKDTTKTLISYSDSPDMGPIASINSYRGCEHGCIYCYARPYHEYLGMSSGVDFETKIFVKENAPELLRRELSHKKWAPRVLMMSGVTDCYQPAERRFQLTRRCLEVLNEFHNPVGIITKNKLVTRDLDILCEMARYDCMAVTVSLTTLNSTIAQKMEPRTSQPQDRLDAIRKLRKAGVPVGVNIAPIVPGLTDEEIPHLVKAAVEAGAQWAGFIVVRLPYAVKDLFSQWLDNHFPDRKSKVINRIKEVRGGKLYDAKWGARFKGEGPYADALQKLFKISVQKYGLPQQFPALSIEHFKDPHKKQLTFFD